MRWDTQHRSRINDVLYYIQQDISRPLLAGELARIAAYSEHHFHRIFKEVVGESVHQYIRRVRLEFAANLLMFDPRSTVEEVAAKAGFSSLSSFSRAFKEQMLIPPGQWRSSASANEAKPYLSDAEIAASYQRIAGLPLPKATMVQAPSRRVAYVRHIGYNRTIRNAWQQLLGWAGSEGRDCSVQFGIHHSNPAWVPLDRCRYVACLGIAQPLTCRTVVNQLTIPGGNYARFSLKGRYGELLPQISQIQEQWLPASGLKMRAMPTYVQYHKNHFLRDDEQFELDLYLPVDAY